MDDQTKQLLIKNIEISEHNNKILKKLHRIHKFQLAYIVLKWVVVAGLLVFGYIQVNQYLETFSSNPSGFFGLMLEKIGYYLAN